MGVKNWLIYGAYGYTGALLATKAQRRGYRPILAGRDAAKLARLGDKLGLEIRNFDLNDSQVVEACLHDIDLVVNVAGPYSATGPAMLGACLRAGAHYLDITGEIDMFAQAQRQHDFALEQGLVVVSGCGFDVVPTDCLAALLKQRLPGAEKLVLAIDPQGGASPGTMKTMVENIGKGGQVRRHGRLKKVPAAWKIKEFEFGHGRRTAMTVAWGDVYTAFESTDIPNIDVYMAVPPATAKRLRVAYPMLKLTGLAPIQALLKQQVEKRVAGPDGDARVSTRAYIYGAVRNAEGQQVVGRMATPNAYDVTVLAALAVTEHLLEGDVGGGYYTPSQLMGADFAASLPGVEVRFD